MQGSGSPASATRPRDFTLNQLIIIADELVWFPMNASRGPQKSITIAGFSHEIRKVRNCVHPGVWSRDRSDPLRFTKGVYGVMYEVIEVANSWLLHRVEKSLVKAMEKEKKASKPTVTTAAAP
jgi:hypothetical protein